MNRSVALALTLVGSVFCAFAHSEYSEQQIQAAINQLNPIVERGLKELNIPGCAVVVVHGDKVLLKKVFGHTTLPEENPIPVSNDTLFPISSMSKSITASLVAALVDAGKIKFEDKVRKYDPNFFLYTEEYSNELRIKDLISHASGFPHSSADSLFAAGYGKEDILKALQYIKPMPGHFRKYYGYQNVIFGMVGDVLEKATGEKYEDLVRKYLFEPCGINEGSAIPLRFESSKLGHIKYLCQRFSYDVKRLGFFSALWEFLKSAVSFEPKAVVKSHSTHRSKTVIQPESDILSIFPASSGISLNAEDGAKWLCMMVNEGLYHGRRVIAQNTFEQLITPVVKAVDIKENDFVFPISRFPRDEISYGVGTFISNYSDQNGRREPIIYHMGGMYGSSSYYAISLKNKLGICVFVNVGGVTHTRLALAIVFSFLDAVFGYNKIDWIGEEFKQREYYKRRAEVLDKVHSSPVVPMAKKEKYIGIYHSDMYGDVTIKLDGSGRLVISNGIKSAVLEHFNGNMFKFSTRDMFVSFINREGTVMFTMNKFGQIDTLSISDLRENDEKFVRK